VTTRSSPRLTLPVTDRDHTQGSPQALVTLVEYGDYQCPDCGRAFPIVEEICREAGDQLLFAFRNFPLTQIHEHAEMAAEAAEAAAAQQRFWDMHRILFTHQRELAASNLLQYASALGMDTEQFRRALTTRAFRDRVHEDFMSGVRSGVNGTPTFFINGTRYDGPVDVSSLFRAIRIGGIPSETES
jgi:protein-disulfide isomerase